ncbi:hypothetical protein TrVE_jg11574 [Triparma verrucosa]|uniref:Uncharacterized protein n=1 Tax=Triparma verrucosa TaxID=1606542 RepID=A0A9W7BGW6_9STRA|nr:hypothetical protein TrVE_jg11574 [Triparma verrucosa]
MSSPPPPPPPPLSTGLSSSFSLSLSPQSPPESKKKKPRTLSPPAVPPALPPALQPPPPTSWKDYILSSSSHGTYIETPSFFEYKSSPPWPTHSTFLSSTKNNDYHLPSSFSNLKFENKPYGLSSEYNQPNCVVFNIPEEVEGKVFVENIIKGSEIAFKEFIQANPRYPLTQFKLLHCVIYKSPSDALNCSCSFSTCSKISSHHAYLTLFPVSTTPQRPTSPDYNLLNSLHTWPGTHAWKSWNSICGEDHPLRFHTVSDCRKTDRHGIQRVEDLNECVDNERRRREEAFNNAHQRDVARKDKERIEREYAEACVTWNGYTLKAASHPTSNPTPDRKPYLDPRVKSFLAPKGYETVLPMKGWVAPEVGEGRTVVFAGKRKTILPPPYPCDFVLHKAVKNNQKEHILSLLDNLEFGPNGIDIDTLEHTSSKDRNRTALSFAAQKGFTEICSLLIERGADVNAFSNGSTSLIQASHFGRVDTVKLLLSKNADPKLSNAKKTTALMRAAQEGHLSIVKLLTSSGAAPDAVNSDGMSSVMLSSQRGHTEIVSHLLSLKGKCDINAVTPENKSTCLHLAVKRSHFETIKVLLREGADIFKKDKKGKTPGEKVKEDGDPRVKSLVNFQSQIMLMREKSRLDGLPIWRLGVENNQPVTTDLIALCATKLPSDVFLYLVNFLPPPPLYTSHLFMIRKNLTVSSSSHSLAISLYLDLIRDILEDAFGFCEGLKTVETNVPNGFGSWEKWAEVREIVKSSDLRNTSLTITPSPSLEAAEALLIKTPSLQRGGFSQEGTASTSPHSSLRAGVDSGLLTAYGLSPLCYLNIISLSPSLRLHLTNSSLPSNLVRNLCDISDVETTLRRRKDNVQFNKNVAEEVYEVAKKLAETAEGIKDVFVRR